MVCRTPHSAQRACVLVKVYGEHQRAAGIGATAAHQAAAAVDAGAGVGIPASSGKGARARGSQGVDSYQEEDTAVC